MQIKTKLLRNGAKLPDRAHADDAGADLFAWSDFVVPSILTVIVTPPAPRDPNNPFHDIWANPDKPTFKYPVGVAVELPKGYFGLVQSKSSVAAKLGLDTMGNVIDEGYRGEIHVVFVNHTWNDVKIEAGQKIAQLIVMPYCPVAYIQSDELSETERGEGGFGSTGEFQEKGAV